MSDTQPSNKSQSRTPDEVRPLIGSVPPASVPVTSNLQFALEYRRRGMCPIPVGSDKRPRVGWLEFQKRLPTEQEIINWWTMWPEAGIALICGHGGFTVLDLDVKGGSLADQQRKKERADRIAESLQNHATVVRTPSGGRHIYLQESDGVSASGPLPDVGDLQGVGRYVLVPPSPGYSYESTLPPLAVPHARDYVATYLQQFGINIEVAPERLVEKDALSKDIQDETRNNTLFSLACSLRHRGADLPFIHTTISVVNREKCKPPLPDDEVERIAQSAMRYEPHSAPSSFPNLTSNYQGHTLEVKSVPAINAGDLQRKIAADGITDPPYLPLLGRKGFIPVGWSVLIAGSPKVGKTELIVSLIEEWVASGLTVFYITEEPQQVWERRIIKYPHIAWDSVRLAFGIGANLPTILALIKGSQEPVVIIDTIRNTLGIEEENNNSEVARTLNPIIELSRRLGRTLILSHHLRKGGGKYGEGISGGHAIFGSVDVGLEVMRDQHVERRRLVKGWGRIFEVPELMYEMTEEGALKALGNPQDIEFNSICERVRSVVNESDDWLKTGEVYEQLDEPRPSREQVRLALLSQARIETIIRDPDISVENVSGKTVKWASKNLTSNDKDVGVGSQLSMEGGEKSEE